MNNEQLKRELVGVVVSDKANKTIHIPNENLSKLGYKMGINYSTEKMYS